MFKILCCSAGFLGFVLVFIDDNEFQSSQDSGAGTAHRTLRWLHSLLAAILHYNAMSLVPNLSSTNKFGTVVSSVVPSSSKEVVPILVNLLSTVVGLVAASTGVISLPPPPLVLWFHWGMFGFNVLTLSGVLLLRWDFLDSDRALEEVSGATYRYKSL